MKVILLFLYLVGCVGHQPTAKGPSYKVKNVGQIKLVDPDNKTYAIYTQNGKSYLPLNLNEKFMRDGLKVTFEGRVDTNRLQNTRLSGIPIKIDKIKVTK